ncbi:MAG TPA: transglycosylase SLT domain-containing protein [Candidatus Sulfotelmatobacter sp.]|nr:transglycosylase SLT domain-containing protein [Candidatus Sulfotelmatobacter sp.]
MAQQLEQDRTPAAYAGVEAFARAHAKEDAGALAWLVDGYAHVLDHEYAKAIDPLNRAKPLAGDLGDYVAYYLGTCYLQTGRRGEALATLAEFDTSHPDSLLVRDAHVAYADALVPEGRAAEAAALLEKDRLPARSDIELALGTAYAATGDHAKAAEALANVYYNMPTSSDADAAYAELRKLPSLPSPTAQQLKTRADLLMKARRYSDAADSYRDLLRVSKPEDRPAAQIALADALHHGSRDREARAELAMLAASGDPLKEHRLFILSEIEWSAGNNDAFYRAVNELREAPQNPWLEQALLSTANLHLVHHEYDQALETYRELQQRYPTGTRASYVHWRAAWLTLRQGHNAEAEKGFEEQIALYPAGAETPAALYWRARLAEEDRQPALARAFYQKLSERYLNYYYAELGRQRLKAIPLTPDVTQHYTLLDRVQGLGGKEKVEDSDPPTDDLHWQKAQLLGNGGLVDFAVRELQAAAGAAHSSWAPAETAKLYAENGQFDRAVELMKHTTPSYFALDLPDLPRSYWEALFPKPYWSDLKRYAAGNGLDPYLVASLIRQESEFNPMAVSRANAIGLMQLLPKTGKLVARQEKLKRYNPSQLYTPAVNLELGTRYFRGMVDRYGGALEYALAAYNAGSERVADWMGQGQYRDPQEFVESIPFTETREYVQAILRNANVYKQLYGTP